MQGRLDRLFERFRRKGDVRALSRVFDLTARELLELASHLAHDPAEAEDLVQATFLAAIEHAERYDRSRHLMPWLVGILVREARSWNRRNARAPEADRLRERDARDPADDAQRSELSESVSLALDRLPPLYREVLVPYLRDAKSSAEIARELGRAPGTVRVQIHRALELLRKALPVSLAGGVALGLATRGLAAVRAEVVRHASVAQVASLSLPVATAVAGGLVVKKTLALAAVVLVAVGTWTLLPEGATVAKPPATASAQAPAVALARPDGAWGARTTELAPAAIESRAAVESPPAASEPAPTPAFGVLEVRVSWHDATPASDVGVYVTPGAREVVWTMKRARAATTNEQGICRFETFPAGWCSVNLDRTQEGKTIEVQAGETTEIAIEIPRGLDLEGVVVDARDEPIAGASVWLCSAWNVDGREAARTAIDGTFRLRSLDDQSTVGAVAKGYVPSGMRWLSDPTLGAGDTRRVRLVLDELGGSVAGIVRDARGAPVANAIVAAGEPRQYFREWNTMMNTLPMPDGSSRFAPAPVRARTDAAGSFLLEDVAPGNTPLAVDAEGWAPARLSVQVAVGELAHFDVTLQPTAKVHGTVLRSNGSPAADISVIAAIEPAWQGNATADADGRYEIGDVPSGRVKLYANPYAWNGEGRAETVLQIAPADDAVWDAKLSAPRSIRGIALGENGEALAGWIVRARASNVSIALLGAGTDGEGRFEIFGCDDDSYDVQLFAPGADWEAMPSAWATEVAPGAQGLVLRVSAATAPTARVAGTLLLPDGSPAGGAKLFASLRSLQLFATGASDASSGRFELAQLCPGDYDLSVSYAQIPHQSLTTFTLRAGQFLDLGTLTLTAPGTVRAVVRADDGSALRDVVVELLSGAHEMTRFPMKEVGDGSFLSPPLLGSRVVHAQASGCAPQRVPVRIVPGEETTVEVRLTRGRLCTLRMLLPDGSDAQQGLWIRLRAPDQTLLVDEPMTDLPAGTEVSRSMHLAPGSYTLDVQVGRTPTRAEFTVGQDSLGPVTFDLRLRMQ